MDSLKKIALIVDDSATARIMLARVLNSMEIESRQVKSGEEALQALTTDHPNLIFLDHLMPGMDGFQTLKALKSNPDTRNIPVIMYTSQSAPRYQEEARTLGASGVITKQVDRNQLYMLVEKAFIQQEIQSSPPYATTHLDAVVAPAAPIEVKVEVSPEESRNTQPLPENTPVHEPAKTFSAQDHANDEQYEQLLKRLRRQRFWIVLLALLVLWCGYKLSVLSEKIGRMEASSADAKLSLLAERIGRLEASNAELAEIISIMQETPLNP